jgi:cytochrome c-type biogenesis protein CcmH
MAEEMRAEIEAKLDAGISPEEIIQDFVAMYGETVLSAPTKRGFNLTAWVIPFGAIAGGLALLSLIVRGFAKRGRERSLELEAEYPEEELEQFSEKIDEELKEYL